MIKWHVEVSEVLDGIAYSATRSAEIDLPDKASNHAVVRRAKAAVGYTGVKCRFSWNPNDDTIVLHVVNSPKHALIYITPCS